MNSEPQSDLPPAEYENFLRRLNEQHKRDQQRLQARERLNLASHYSKDFISAELRNLAEVGKEDGDGWRIGDEPR